ncbi:MAG: CbbQ/NirQ/NorQ/GpvN family protein [SAR202 cluster bacterium]|nr:CbbQ/NirQ/NorQ/GpvN family protein [SAR202 cluster bacterium]
MAETNQSYRSQHIEEYVVHQQPFYLPVKDEVQLFEAAYRERVPILLKGPTGSGKTRFVEFMSWRLGQDLGAQKRLSKAGFPLVTVACHEDLTASDLVGRYLLEVEGTRWIDGPLTRAVKHGGICYLDEVVEARKDTTVLIHPLADHRRLLHIEKLGEVLEAHPNFLLVISYNPGYQSALKDLKHSTRQRFVAVEFDFPPRELEGPIIEHEAGVDRETASSLALLGEKIRNLRGHGLQEGVSTRLLIYAGKMIVQGIAPRRACQVAVVWGLTDDHETQRSVNEVVTSIFP